MYTFKYVEGIVHPYLKELDEEPIKILSRGDDTTVIEFINNKNKSMKLRENLDTNIPLVPNECINYIE